MHLLPHGDHPHMKVALQSLTERAQALTRGDAAAIALAHQGSMICRASVGNNAPALGARLDTSTGFSGECVRSCKALLCEDSDSDPRVDAKVCRRLGIRSILAAPIPWHGEVVGLLEVFSSQRFAFHDGDLALVQQLADNVLATTTLVKPTPPPKLLIEMEPAHRVFWENLSDILFPPRLAPLKLTSRPARFWPDVFVPSPLPWQRFGHSVLLHGMMLIAMVALLKFGISQPRLVTQNGFNKSDVVYYLPAEYQPVRNGKEVVTPRSRPAFAFTKQEALVVRRASVSRAQISPAPPNLSLKGDLRLVRLIAANTPLPVAPAAAATRTQLTTPALDATAVAPPPEVSGMARTSAPALATPAVVRPAPSVSESIHTRGKISIGQLQVVAPAPQVPFREGGLTLSTMRSTLASTEGAVVPPTPSLNGLERSGLRAGSLGNGNVHVVPPAPSVNGLDRSGLRPASSGSGGFHVVPPAPTVTGLDRSGLRAGSLGNGNVHVVPPAPAVNGLDRSGLRPASLGSGSLHVVPPAPTVQIARSYGSTFLGGKGANVVPPPPSITGGVSRSGARAGSSFSGGSVRVVPPAPVVQRAGSYGASSGTTMAIAAVPPAPSASLLGSGYSRGSTATAGTQMPLPAIAAPTNVKTSGASTLASSLPGGFLPGELTSDTRQTLPRPDEAPDPKFPDAKVLNVNFIGPALVLPASSYFLSYEVFIAEERVTRHQSRLIKLVYDFLPYQPRLSDYGPNYPPIENLRATRDPSCDAAVDEVEASTRAWPRSDRDLLNAKSSNRGQSSLPCYRTTADDYRKARARRSSPNRDR